MGERGQWGSRLGFVLAAAGSAIGLGNIWKFPYITGVNGGGLFVLIYLVCITGVGLPIMMAEILIGRTAQRSPVGAFRLLSRPGSPWVGVGWLGFAAAFVILSYYSVVAGWALHYSWLSLSGGIAGHSVEELKPLFGQIYQDTGLNLFWHVVFMALTVGIVIGGVRGGVERAARVLMPVLFVMMLALLVYAMTLDGFGQGLRFVFAPHRESLSSAGVLEALGHSFFTLSLGMGAMLTYGSYLSPRESVVATSAAVTLLDTFIALMACLILFPITFSFGMEPAAGPGLVFTNIPIALSQVPAGAVWSTVFFLLLVFAALTSAISLLEVAAAYFIDERGWSRRRAVLLCGAAITVFGIPSALSGGTALFGSGVQALTGRNWFDTFDYLASNWMLPLGGLGIALFVSWRVGDAARREALAQGSTLGVLKGFYLTWLSLLRYVVPVAIVAIVLHAIGVL
ncbi:MAG: sodium-dependent transporter [Pseudomonadota bacterium]